MRTLVTGSSGTVGRAVVERLRRAGHEVVPFDLDDGVDIRCDGDIARRLDGVSHVVHLAAVLGWHGESADDHMAVNLFGTWRLLEGAVQSRVSRVVFVSSVDVLGVFKGERAPDYLPLDDDHPCYPSTPYATAKRLAEVLCEDVHRTHGVETIVLRPPGVWTDETYAEIAALRADAGQSASEGRPRLGARAALAHSIDRAPVGRRRRPRRTGPRRPSRIGRRRAIRLRTGGRPASRRSADDGS